MVRREYGKLKCVQSQYVYIDIGIHMHINILIHTNISAEHTSDRSHRWRAGLEMMLCMSCRLVHTSTHTTNLHMHMPKA
jgi:hypothetical protein